MTVNNNQQPSEFVTNLYTQLEVANSPKEGEFLRAKIRGYSGAAVDLSDYGLDHPVVYDMEGIDVTNQRVPYLLDHRRNQILGNTEKIEKGSELVAEVVHSYPSELAKETAQAVANKIPYQASMGLRIDTSSVQHYVKGSVTVNGRTFTAPIYVVRSSKLVELSATLFGRDGNTEVTKLSKENLMLINNNVPSDVDNKDKEGTPDLATQLENAKKEAAEKAKQLEIANKELEKVKNANNPAPDNKETKDTKETQTDVNNRLTNVLNWMVTYKDHPELVKNAVANGWDEQRLKDEVALKNKMNSLPGVPGIHIPDNKVENALEARVALAAGINGDFLVKKLGEKTVEHAAKLNQIGLKELIMQVANANGGQFNGHSDSEAMCKYLKKVHNSMAYSTVDFPNLMHRITEWRLEEAWMLDAPFAPTICTPLSNNNFNPVGHIKPKGGTMWNGLTDDGKILHASFGKEDTYLTELHTFAQLVAFKRQDIENDNIGIINTMLDLMVEGATMIPDYQLVNLIYNALTAGVLVNNETRFALALNLTNLETLYNKVKLRTITKGDLAVKARNITKWKLVVTPELEKTAWEIINQKKFVQGPDNTYVGEDNFWAGKFQVVTFDQLSNTTYHADAKVGTWGLVPDNVKYSPFAITYFKGRTRPTIETVDLPADMLGFGTRGYWDVNLDYRPVEKDKLQATAWSFPN